jgi:hypothetical protein
MHENGTIKLIPTIEEMLKLPPNSIPPNRHREMTPEGYQVYPNQMWLIRLPSRVNSGKVPSRVIVRMLHRKAATLD